MPLPHAIIMPMKIGIHDRWAVTSIVMPMKIGIHASRP